MGYLALLFCPDEKTARTVTHVLNDLDFTVEPCTEPFAAVKKLMAQHFDAVVVDCDNEQNATLLFKSARNSASNQSSLAVAVVEGQAGVAKAFRIGANLVLTRPINVEQAKGTLRVARGLLRKGAEAKTAAKPATPTASTAAPSMPSSTPSPARPARPTPPRPAASSAPTVGKSAPKFAPAPARPQQAAPPIAARAMDVLEDHEPDTILDDDDTEILDVPAAPATKPQPPATPAAGTSKFPWQPAKPMAEPMGSALRRAAEVAAKIESANTDAPPRPSGFTSSEDRLAASAGMSRANAAASAPARAKERTAAPPPGFAEPIATKAPTVEISETKFASKPAAARATKTVVESKVVERKAEERPSTSSESNYYTPAHEEPAPPTFFPGAYDPDEVEGGSNVKAIVIIAMVVLLACSAAYLSWRNMNGKGSPGAQPAQAAPASAPNSSVPKPGAGQPSDKPSAAAEPETADITLGGTSPAGTTHTATKPSPKTTAPAAETDTEPEVTQRLIVKNEPLRKRTPAAAPQQEAVQEPTGIALGAAPDPKALAGLNTGPANTPKPAAQVIKVSQGVMEGLLLKRAQPRYPAQAMQMRIQGPVQLQATISKTGDITNLKVVSGDGILARSAQEAVKQWKYKPYFLNGDPVEIQTQILVNFKLPN